MPNSVRPPMIIAVTGGIACGKSTVGKILEKMGFSVCDADRLAHEIMRQGTPVFQQIVNAFGTEVLAADGSICRPKLGALVFDDSKKRVLLNRLVHPAVREALEHWVAECRAHAQPAAAQVPLLFESGMETIGWDAVVCVSGDEAQVLKRLKKRGFERPDALRRIRAQMPLKDKEERSDEVIHNLGTVQELEVETMRVVNRLMHER